MFTVYILKNEDGKLYKGCTCNLSRRLKEHRGGHTKTTSRMGSLQVTYTEEFSDFDSARKRELYFKSGAGRKFLKKVLQSARS